MKISMEVTVAITSGKSRYCPLLLRCIKGHCRIDGKIWLLEYTFPRRLFIFIILLKEFSELMAPIPCNYLFLFATLRVTNHKSYFGKDYPCTS